MKKKRRYIWIFIMMILFLLFCVYMTFPMSLGDHISENQALSAAVIVSHVTKKGKPDATSETYEVSPDSQEFEEITALLNAYTYHRNFRSLIPLGNYTMDRQTTTIILSAGDCCITLTDGGDLAIDNSTDTGTRLYSIGYFGNGKAEQLCEEIQAILERSTTTDEIVD
ncbi:hypothetical protein [uncultured Ruminococcus sp.]|uniref:hypothetical protein n=1 Tax=uncultured Ruminococcus sp. TaxID=165186 RepID=UPI002602BE87|nr:hypothetical protein [uncultured Ruminococcus sp.]